MSMTNVQENIEPQFMSRESLFAEVRRLRNENTCLREGTVYLTEKYDNNLDTVLHKLNKRTFELMEANQELAARVNSCPSTCEAYKL